MVMLFGAKAQAPTDKDGAKAFVQQFYSWYVPLYEKGKPAADLVALKQKATWFDAAVSNAIKKDYSEQPPNAGEILGLDFDPFLSAQDTGFDYQAGSVKQVGNKFLVDIHAGLIGKSKKEILAAETVVIAQVTNVGGHWKFTNFLYPVGGDLLTVLTNLRDDRAKWLAKHHPKAKKQTN
jgi:hypothetical protein